MKRIEIRPAHFAPVIGFCKYLGDSIRPENLKEDIEPPSIGLFAYHFYTTAFCLVEMSRYLRGLPL